LIADLLAKKPPPPRASTFVPSASRAPWARA
jgi:hypothetical protein